MNDRTLWSHDINLDDQPVSASQARAFVRHRLVEHHLAHLSDDVELVVSELATNAMRHAQTAFTVSLHAFEQTLLLEVEDGSSVWPTRVAAAHLRDTHGRGLKILDLLCRDWGMDALPNGSKSVWAEFSLPGNASLGRRAGRLNEGARCPNGHRAVAGSRGCSVRLLRDMDRCAS